MTWGSGRFWAYVGVALGLSASLAANYAHTNVPPPAAPPGWSPRPGAVVLSLCWPVLLFVAAEILVRTQWPREVRWLAVRYLGLLPVAGVAALVSYRHMSGLLTFYGEDSLTSTVGPLAIDGLMIMATGALLATATPRADSGKSSSVAAPGKAVVAKRPTTDALTVARQVALEIVADGGKVNRRALTDRLRARGHPVSNARAGRLLQLLTVVEAEVPPPRFASTVKRE